MTGSVMDTPRPTGDRVPLGTLQIRHMEVNKLLKYLYIFYVDMFATHENLLKGIIRDLMSRRGRGIENDMQQCLIKRGVKETRNAVRGIR